MAAAAKLPGVYFAVEPRRVAEDLPRMDVAAFAGFAASGPLHVPVPVEDVGRFRDIFGPEVTLARDEARNDGETSWLGLAVEAFFRQGGRRCWVVRVADDSTAVTVDLQIPGLWEAGAAPAADPSRVGAAALARSPGWWATGLSIGTRLRRDRLAPSQSGIGWQGDGWTLDLEFAPVTFAAGDLLELVLPAENLLFLLFVDEWQTHSSAADPRIGFDQVRGRSGYWYRTISMSPPEQEFPIGADHPHLEPVPAGVLAALQAQAASGSPALVPAACHRLTFDLLSWQGGTIERRLDKLGFGPEHPRFWALMKGDSPLFETTRGRKQTTLTPEQQLFESETASPRFPMAAPETPAERYLPLGMAIIEDVTLAWSPPLPGVSRLTFDGLEVFSDALFLDERLRSVLTGALLGEAEHRHYEDVLTANTSPLRGLHSLLTVSEVSMIAVPDAVHRGWTMLPPETPPPLAAPDLRPIPPADALGRVAVRWTGPSEADSFRLEIARTICFRAPDIAVEIPAAESSPPGNFYNFVPAADCPVVWRFRVRSERLGEISPWSRTRSAVIPARHFEKCGEFAPGSAALILRSAEDSSPPGLVLLWDYEDLDDDLPEDSYELQMAFDPGFIAPQKIATGHFDTVLRRYEVPPQSDKVRYFRIRIVREKFRGDWSNVVIVNLSTLTDWTSLPEAEFDNGSLLAIHRALIRFCAARADAAALLSLPRHYREADVREHVGLLLPRVESDSEPALMTGVLQIPALTFGEDQDGAPSYAALYHPWTAVALPLEEGNRAASLRVVYAPPDGAAAGSIAARTIQSGAWISPANQPLAGVVGLDPSFDIEEWGRLTEAQTNIAVEQPRGFVFLNAETLTGQEDLRELCVRRLLILLRRLALREGETFVFEPNSADFRSLVRQRFERWMSDMYVRGAFQGRTPDAGFRVVVDESVNPPLAIEQGRFFVELRVAPSRPFRFINVRLLQTAPERLTVSEA